jgi:ABC-type polysaccharide/polyol phosphate export permease
VKVLVARSVGSLIAGLPAVVVLVALVGIVSGKHEVLDPAIVPPLLLLELCATGVGLMLASGALVFKRIRLLLVAMQVAVIFLVMLPASADGEWLRVLPISTQVQALRATVRDGVHIGLGAMAMVVANAAVYFLAGATLLHAASRRVRRRGQLAHH